MRISDWSSDVCSSDLGHLVREVRDRRKLVRMLATRAAWLIGAALVMSLLVPINKRLWSPSYAVITLGTSFAWFALGIRLLDIAGRTRILAPLLPLGANPLAIYSLFIATLTVPANPPRPWSP